MFNRVDTMLYRFLILVTLIFLPQIYAAKLPSANFLARGGKHCSNHCDKDNIQCKGKEKSNEEWCYKNCLHQRVKSNDTTKNDQQQMIFIDGFLSCHQTKSNLNMPLGVSYLGQVFLKDRKQCYLKVVNAHWTPNVGHLCSLDIEKCKQLDLAPGDFLYFNTKYHNKKNGYYPILGDISMMSKVSKNKKSP